MNGQCRQAVGDHDHQVHASRMSHRVITQGLRRGITEFSPQVGALQVRVAIRRRTVQQKALAITFGQLRAEGGMVKRQVHRIPRLSVGVLEVQLCAGGNAGAGAAQGNSRRRQAS
ncbi:hypothetical protein D3C86_1725550 [compost metagenome]